MMAVNRKEDRTVAAGAGGWRSGLGKGYGPCKKEFSLSK